jgi:hypothetical protein
VKPRLHVMFNPSGAGSLRQALAQAGRDEVVVSHDDTLSFGPINPPDPGVRAEWVGENLGYDGWEEVSGTIAPFMAASLARDVRPVAWFSQRDTQSFTGFLEWLRHRGDEACEIVDVSELRVSYRGGLQLAISPSMLTPEEFIEKGLLDRALPLAEADCAKFTDLWSSLRAEDAP